MHFNLFVMYDNRPFFIRCSTLNQFTVVTKEISIQNCIYSVDEFFNFEFSSYFKRSRSGRVSNNLTKIVLFYHNVN